MQASHHPKARQRKPRWREKEIPTDPNLAAPPLTAESAEPKSDEVSEGPDLDSKIPLEPEKLAD
jgi:hypothetical protein